MFSPFMTIKKLPVERETRHIPNVKTFTENWVKDIKHQLTVTNTALLCCNRDERRFHKEKAKTLNDVLHLLQGNRHVKKSKQGEEVESLKMQLQQVSSDYEKANADCTLHKMLNADLKMQLNRQFKSTNHAMKKNMVLRSKVQSMSDMYSRESESYQNDPGQMITQLKDLLCDAERKLSFGHHKSECMKELFSHRLMNCLPVKDVSMKTPRVLSLQQAAYKTLTATLSDQGQMITELRDHLSEAERKHEQARECFLMKEQELKEIAKTLKEKLEGQKTMDTVRVLGTILVWTVTMFRIFFW